MVGAAPLATDREPGRPGPETIREWQSRKFGMFIHFGLYSELGGVWKGRQYSGNYSEQIQSDAHIPEPDYARLASSFNPVNWNPDAVVELGIDAGMKFIVITSKHHDGFSLFATKQSPYNVVNASPYKRDIVKGLAEACARRHMPFGVYYSTIDWHFGDIPDRRNDNPLSHEHEEFNVAQLKELTTGYGPLSEIWFDMGHPTKLQSRHFAQTVHRAQPEAMISGRVWNNEGDFSEMGDDAVPDYILDEPWESPASIFADTWGYRSWEKRTNLEAKTREHVLRLIKVASRGGNYILNIGPRGDGSVVPYEADVLRGIGRWLQQNGEAIYGVRPQPFRELDFGYATVKDNRLFLFVEHPPQSGRIALPGFKNRIQRARLLGDDQGSTLPILGANVISLKPAQTFIPVIAVDFEGPLKVEQPATHAGTDGVIRLTTRSANLFYNANGEGYSDPPTIRKQEWHVAIDRPGTYKIELLHQPGKFARVLDISIGGRIIKANVYGDDHGPATAGSVKLERSSDMIMTVTPGSPAERAAPLGVTLDTVSLVFQSSQP
ncbi:MAG: glycoside hydrolase family 29 (alpha-L-fucosidase) [Bryobacterales bacterium]|nr:glycoside hydrolase family 29 (alpha-L-fucosidase) [Bryobacterales bacterium]